MKSFIRYCQEDKLGKGYIGKSMSVNAKIAYDNDEMPLSKWNKSIMNDVLSSINPDLEIKKIPLDILKQALLVPTHQHHTSAFFNYTEFYKIKDKVANWSQNDLEKEAEFYKKYGIKKNIIKRDSVNDYKVDELFSKLEYIFDSGVVKYKFLTALINLLRKKGIKEIDSLFDKAIKNSSKKFEIKKHNRNSWNFKFLEQYLKSESL